ncbi:MAG: hypothetical protein QM569_09230 [Acidovorax sp.]|uniref:hypothetical protein n=1 Tax=Acidovorax sp. TaxID=1872122 RepID=UPI0039E56AF1
MQDDVQAQQVIARLVIRAANQIAEGKSKSEVISELKKEGCPTDLAQIITLKGEEIKKDEFRKGGRNAMLLGAGLAGLGVAITAGTYSLAASSGGGSYFITYGLIIVGAWIFIKGLWRSMAG